jgi:hypothetical protein
MGIVNVIHVYKAIQYCIKTAWNKLEMEWQKGNGKEFEVRSLMLSSGF